MEKEIEPKHFKWHKSNEISPSMLSYWQENGFLIFDNFYSQNDCEKLKTHATNLIDSFDPNENKVIFSTKEQNHSSEEYFQTSGDKIRFFLEEGAVEEDGSLNRDKKIAINKIGHAMHDLDPTFSNFSRQKN